MLGPDDFYPKIAEIFTRNSKWSKKKPVPEFGSGETPIEVVYKFYKFWDNFDSWRDFSQYDEYDPREAADRYERRYMENENKKLRAKHVKKERARINLLVELSYKYDFRILEEKKKEEAEK